MAREAAPHSSASICMMTGTRARPFLIGSGIFFSAMGGPSVAISEEQAFASLCNDYDSVKLTRRSDGAATIIYRHDENASDAQRYFFTREAWVCDPEGETQKDRTYTLILTDDMFK